MVRGISQLAIALLLAVGLMGCALLTVQNVDLVSLQLLMFQSIQVPVGLLLTACGAGGLILGALFSLLPGGDRRKKIPSRRELDAEFDFDDLS